LIRMAREGVATASRAGTSKADAATVREPVVGRWRINRAISEQFAVRQSVQSIMDGSGAPMLLVCFERRPLVEMQATALNDGDDVASGGTTALEEELTATREHLYTVIEELETSNEESQSLNEEIQTANEELQSTNEELEATNEELQASNEELTTVNEELQVKSAQWQALSAELEGIYSTVDFPLLAFDARLVLTRTNVAVQRQLGIDESWLGKQLAVLPWPTGMPSLLETIEQVASTGRTVLRQLSDVGSRDWVVRVMPRTDTDGSPAGVLVQLEDNTELRKSQQAAMRSSAQLQQLVEHSAHLVCICDPVGRLQMANPEFERCHGLAPGSAVGSLVKEILPELQAQAFREAQIEAIRILAPVEREETLHVGVEPRILLASYYPLLDADGAVSGVCYQALDITRRKKAEAALLAASSAQLAAESMARTKSGFLANMSHEIRTPMNAVLGLSRMLLQEELTPSAREKLDKVHDAAKALTRILDDILDFSKIEAGAMKFERRQFLLTQVLNNTRSLFGANAQEKSIGLTVDPLLGVPTHLIGDSFRLSQVLNNLVSNAVKFTDAGEVRIGVAPYEASAARPGWIDLRFSVRDTGKGIALHERETLFQPYTQADSSVTRRFGGTGLGLAICRRLVEQMQGRIGVNSEQGFGSEFWFTCSFELQQDIDGQPPTESSSSGPTPVEPRHEAMGDGDGEGLHVLLAEDNELNQIVGVSALERMGHRVTITNDGAEAIAAVKNHPPGYFDVVLMDLHMPHVDGLEATRTIKALPQGVSLPILALTAAALAEDREQCLAAGMAGHIAKPLQPEELRASLARVKLTGANVAQFTDKGPTNLRGRGASSEALELPAVQSFDLPALLERARNNQTLALRLLEAFLEEHRNTGQELAELVHERRFDEAKFRTHTLMGSATTVGAIRVAELSASVHAALRDCIDTPGLLQALKEALDDSVADAQRVLAQRCH
jgi:two-component system CheB/CheR fusion protein